jgi:hypothetical protein
MMGRQASGLKMRAWRKAEQFCEAWFVRLTFRTIAIGLNPLGMLHPQVIVDLLLKLDVRADFVRRVRFHHEKISTTITPLLFRVSRIFQYYSGGDP